MLAILLNGLATACCLRYQQHVRLTIDDGCDPLAKQGVVVNAENPNPDLIAHSLLPFCADSGAPAAGGL